MKPKNKIQLITYPNSLGGDLKGLHKALKNHFSGLFDGGVHILPPFPSSGDRGFAPLTYLEIAPEFGTWEDLSAIGEEYDVALDIMVNHISAQSEFFKDFLKNGKNSRWAELFLTLDKIWESGVPSQEDLDKVFLRRTVPYSPYRSESDGQDLTVWTTFGPAELSQQIDLDIYSEKTRELLVSFFEKFAKHKVRLVRLDAVGFVIKKMGTSCFFVKPEIYDFLSWIGGVAADNGIEILPEVHGEPSIARELTENGYYTYDFILPYTVLNMLLRRDSTAFYKYLETRPEKLFTMLDCHDGLPVKPDLNGSYVSEEAHGMVDICEKRGALFSRILSDQYKDPDGFDVHQICGTLYSLLNQDDDAYVTARAIQFFVPGIPQVYYVGLLAGLNDRPRADETGDRREINRHNFTEDEINTATQSRVFQRLKWLMTFRNTHPAFDGVCTPVWLCSTKIRLEWRNEGAFAALTVDLPYYYHGTVSYTSPTGELLEKLL